jgi:hypothetical protein
LLTAHWESKRTEMEDILEIGSPAPDFILAANTGKDCYRPMKLASPVGVR